MRAFEGFVLDERSGCLVRDGNEIALPPKAYAVLKFLVENSGRLITQDELLEALWPKTYVQPQVLRTYVLELRKALGDAADKPRFIQTIPKRGYRFVAAVREADAGEATDTQEAIEQGRTAPDTRVPGGSDNGQRPALAGRDRELSLLRARLREAEGGRRQVVLVEGEAGVGKSALVDAFVDGCAASAARGPAARGTAADNGRRSAMRVAVAQCVGGFGTHEEHYAVMDALRQLCAGVGGDKVCAALARLAPGWLTGLGQQAGAGGPVAGGAGATGAGLEGICAAIEEICASEPLLLVFEDVNRADHGTLQLLSALARRRTPARLMVVATSKPQTENGHAWKHLRQDLAVHRLVTEMVIEPLDAEAVEAMISRLLATDELPQGLAASVHDLAEGNPLFVRAIVEHMQAERLLVETGGAWQLRGGATALDAGVPTTLESMIALEVERLDAPLQRLLEAGSLMPLVFPAWAVAAALEMDEQQAEELCESLPGETHFVRLAGEDELPNGSASAFYVFTHSLYREVLLGRQTATRRARRHARIAARLGELFAPDAGRVAREMAWHYEAAGQWALALKSLEAGVAQAGSRKAQAEVVELLERALRVAERMGDGAATQCADLEVRLREARKHEAAPETSKPSGRRPKSLAKN